ncbi:sugar ABC transporter permease [Metabacillus sp. GX 13764]|uniref:carbohydrate ABC transporter permease n=1 Tax=Metabacillus kandeliae TaxID=2900151 RepID=UPI001E355218|nr:sugar ABC transporter permease [Metabacillus kandeliae]MCD7033683.1 sugar ABC transporter permease [Metabacillus kandeliae]
MVVEKQTMSMSSTKIQSLKKDKRKRFWAPYLFVLPNLLIFLIFIIIPAIMGLVYSFTNYNGVSKFSFIGLENYTRLFASEEFWKVFLNTIQYAVMVVPLVFAVSLFAAVLLIKELKGRGFFRAIFYWPTMISFIIVGLTWKWIFGDSFGIVTYLLEAFHLPAVKWLSDPFFAKASIVMATVWSRLGFFMVIFIAGLQSIPASYYEAAQLDGAGRWQTFWKITFPLLKPTSLLVFLLLVVESAKSYPLVFALTGGGPAKETTLIVQYIYENGFTKSDVGYASAMSVILFVVIAVFSLIQYKWAKGGSYE